MKISDLISLSAKNLARRKGRTALTVIGVVVGTCAVIVMISLGIAQNKNTDEMLQNFGDLTNINVYGGGAVAIVGGGGGSSSKNQPAKLDDAALAGFKTIANVVAVTPQYRAWNTQGTINAGKTNRYTASYGVVWGLYPEAMEPMGFTLSQGNWLSPTEKYGKDKLPVLVCANTAYQFADTRKSANSSKRQRYQGQTDAAGNPVEPFFDINSTPLSLTITDGAPENPKTRTWQLVVVGVVTEDRAKGWWTSDGIVMRVSDMRMVDRAYQDLIKQKSTTTPAYDEVTVKVDDVKNVEATDAVLKEMGYSTYSMTQTREEMQKSVAQSQLILGGLAAISLLVAALNIANTMTMAIYERTREIGVMKVLGCELGHIRGMFLIESGFIGFIGGVVGSIISLGISAILNNISTILALFGGGNVDISSMMGSMNSYGTTGSAISIVPPWLLLLALAFATLIGLLSGIAPAGRAVKISALEAIRHD
ncbi:MAG: ABC transporter permease [Gemmiger sp.]|nr:ABC transporter permease [Gemmiger sp.]